MIKRLKWDVERRPESFETVLAHTCDVSGGSVVFYDLTPQGRKIVLAYPAGQWVSVCESAEDV